MARPGWDWESEEDPPLPPDESVIDMGVLDANKYLEDRRLEGGDSCPVSDIVVCDNGTAISVGGNAFTGSCKDACGRNSTLSKSHSD